MWRVLASHLDVLCVVLQVPRLGWFKGTEAQQGQQASQQGSASMCSTRFEKTSAPQTYLPAESYLPAAQPGLMAPPPPRFTRPSQPQQQPIPLFPPPPPTFVSPAAPVQAAQEPVEEQDTLQELHAATRRRPRCRVVRKPCSVDQLQQRAAWLNAPPPPQPPPPLPATPAVPLLPLLSHLQTAALAAQGGALGGLDLALLAQMAVQAQGLQSILAQPPPQVQPMAARPQPVQAQPQPAATQHEQAAFVTGGVALQLQLPSTATQPPILLPPQSSQAAQPAAAVADTPAAEPAGAQQGSQPAAAGSSHSQHSVDCVAPTIILHPSRPQAATQPAVTDTPMPTLRSPSQQTQAQQHTVVVEPALCEAQGAADGVGGDSMQVDDAAPCAEQQQQPPADHPQTQSADQHHRLVVKVCPPTNSEASSQHSAATLRSCGSGLLDLDGDVAMACGDEGQGHEGSAAAAAEGRHVSGASGSLDSPVYPCASADDSPTPTPALTDAQPAVSVTCKAGSGAVLAGAVDPCSPASPISDCDMMTA